MRHLKGSNVHGKELDGWRVSHRRFSACFLKQASLWAHYLVPVDGCIWDLSKASVLELQYNIIRLVWYFWACGTLHCWYYSSLEASSIVNIKWTPLYGLLSFCPWINSSRKYYFLSKIMLVKLLKNFEPPNSKGEDREGSVWEACSHLLQAK